MNPTRRTVLKGFSAGAFLVVLPAGPTEVRKARAATPNLRTQRLVTPQAVSSSSGAVSNADALVQGGYAMLQATGERPASVVLDYGRIVGGLPAFEIDRVSGEPTLTAIYAQALPWLLPDGDGPAPGKPGATAAAPKEVSFVGIAGAADLSRVQRIPLHTGAVVGRLIQGGQRFQALQLSGEGSLSLHRVGYVPTFRQPTRSPNQGRFSCSDDALTEIWGLGAYTLDVASLPAGALPPLWDIGADGATVYGDTYTGYQAGSEWTDYTARFAVKIVANEASWLVHGTSPDGIRMVLCAAGDVLQPSKPNTLRVYVQFTQALISEVPLPFDVHEGEWHTVETAVSGATARVSIDGQPIISFEIPVEGGFWGNTTKGWVALGNASGAIATFRDLSVNAADGSTLLTESLTDPSVLDRFVAGASTLSTIVDGATRDRLLFTGDLGVASQTLVYSNFDLPYLTDSIRMFSAYQAADGAVPTSVPPQANPGRTPGNAFRPGITDYTVHHVTTIYTYWLHSGDLAFLRRQWLNVTRVLAYLEENSETDGLFAPLPASPTAPRVAETLTNAHYYGALHQAAAMASALGLHDDADRYMARADQLRTAINARLFNPAIGLYGATTADLNTVVEHANAYAVLYRVAYDELIPSILAKLAATLDTPLGPIQSTSGQARIGPYTAGYDVLARLDAADTSSALDIIRRAWAPMRAGQPYYSGATWEYVALDATPGLGTGTSLAHPWASAPTPALSKYILGARPVDPGFATWLVEPQPGDLQWARGVVPTPHGPLTVLWARNDDTFSVIVDGPPRTHGFVGIPINASQSQLRLDNRNRQPSIPPSGITARQGYKYLGPIGSGTHTVTAR